MCTTFYCQKYHPCFEFPTWVISIWKISVVVQTCTDQYGFSVWIRLQKTMRQEIRGRSGVLQGKKRPFTLCELDFYRGKSHFGKEPCEHCQYSFRFSCKGEYVQYRLQVQISYWHEESFCLDFRIKVICSHRKIQHIILKVSDWSEIKEKWNTWSDTEENTDQKELTMKSAEAEQVENVSLNDDSKLN